MTRVDTNWLADDATYYVQKLDGIADEIDGDEPVNGEVSGDDYDDAREFINTIREASELLFDAHVHVVDGDEIQKPIPFTHYRNGYEKVQHVATRELPNVTHEWTTTFDNAKADLQDILSELPRP